MANWRKPTNLVKNIRHFPTYPLRSSNSNVLIFALEQTRYRFSCVLEPRKRLRTHLRAIPHNYGDQADVDGGNGRHFASHFQPIDRLSALLQVRNIFWQRPTSTFSYTQLLAYFYLEFQRAERCELKSTTNASATTSYLRDPQRVNLIRGRNMRLDLTKPTSR